MVNKAKRFITFKFKFITLFIVILTVVFSLQVYISKYFIKDIVHKKSQGLFEETVTQIAKRMDIYLMQANELVVSIKHDQRIKNDLLKIKMDKANYYLSKYKIIREVFRKANLYNADNLYIYTYDNSPINCFYSTPSIQTPPEYRQYFEQENSLMNNNIVWRVRDIDPYVLEAVTYIKNETEILGLLVINFNETIFDDIFTRYGEFEGGQIILLDSSNEIVYHTQKEFISQNIYNIIDKQNIIIEQRLDFSNWKMIGILNREGFNEEINEINKVFLFVFIAMIGTITVIPIIVNSWVIKPMDKIVQGMKNIQSGNYNFQIQNNAKDEFGIIIDNFNFMVRKIRELINKIVEQQRIYRQAEMQALMAKINPHFLYNTLDMIHWMLVIEDKYEIANVITILSDMLRYSMANGDDFVTIREDLDQISQYLTIQKLRFSGKLEYEIILEGSILDCKIPRLLIQPLVENAIKYAFSEMREDGHIYISVKESHDGRFIYFTVKDNGIGMTNDKILKIQNDYANKNKKTGFGIQLVQSTIQHTYGNDCGLTITSARNKGTVITVKIKKHLQHLND